MQFKKVHIGSEIKKTIKEQGRTVTWFSTKICMDRTNVYRIFKSDSIDTKLLQHIGEILNYNFFALYYEAEKEE